MRRNEVLGLQWGDLDAKKGTVAISRGIVDVGYEIRQTRDKTPRSRRPVDLDQTTLDLLASWRAWRLAEAKALGAAPSEWMFSDHRGEPVHPQSVSQAFKRIVNRADVRALTFDELRHTHATLLLKDRIPIKVVTERLGHSNPVSMATYQHVLPGMQAEAATTFEQLIQETPRSQANKRPGKDGRRNGRNPGEDRL